MKGAYLKSTFRDIFKAPGRMLSIILIIMMGVLLFVGIKAVGPNLENTMDSYYRKYNLSDVQVTALNQLSFPFVIHWQGYLIATLGTIFFTAIVSFSTHIKLRNVDMIKALKSSD